MKLGKYSIFALAMLTVMGIIAVASIREDSVTTDESPHVASGYSYLKLREYRLNPEHPPLIKDLAAIPLLFQNLNFPENSPAWTNMVNAQWDLGPQFLYQSGNDPNKMIFWARIGPILLTLLFGWIVFKWARELFGSKWALFTLALFTFSPTIMAHGRLVTTDVAAAFAFFIAIYAYVRFLQNPSKKNLLVAGFAFGIAQLLKFSLVLLFGFLPALTILWILLQFGSVNIFKRDILKAIFFWKIRFLAILAITAFIILPVYQFHVTNYPPEKQIEDIQFILQSSKFPALTDALVWMADKPILRAYAQYILGVSMVFIRVAGGNTAYFLGQVSNQAWWYYFPIVFLLKVPSSLLIFIALSFVALALRFRNNFKTIGVKNVFGALPQKVKDNFDEVAMFLFVLFYWGISITGNLNLGVRHVLPTFPFIYLLIAGQMRRWMSPNLNKALVDKSIQSGMMLIILELTQLFKHYTKNIGKVLIIFLLLLWYTASLVGIYPHFLAYFNEFAGGPANGYKYVVDSNLDWGQDLRRLEKFVTEKNIDRIKVDYFGGSDIKYYLGDKAENWHADNGPTTGWLAVSATFLQTSRGNPNASYKWLDKYEPIKKIGFSIFVYNIK